MLSTYAHRLALMLLAGLLGSCSTTPVARDADVIVVGTGIAGLSAALEASAQGARVLLLDANSVGGGHAVKAGGFALVDTALQRSKGITDSPGLAFGDWAVRGKNPDAYWAYRYAEDSSSEVYDWLVNHGVVFHMVLPTNEDSVPRFHFTRGTAVNAVVPLLRQMLYDTNIDFRWNTRAVALVRLGGRINGVLTRNERTGEEQLLRAGAVLLATGGLQNNLQQVRDNWAAGTTKPSRLLRGAGQFATGDGYRLAEWAGADMLNMDRQVIFYNGIPNPRDASSESGLLAQNPMAIWVNSTGRRFVNEDANIRVVTDAVSNIDDPGYWMIFDADGARRFGLRGAPWISRDTVNDEVLNNPTLVSQANTISELAKRAGLPEHGLRTTVETWNRMVAVGEDYIFQRFEKGTPPDRSIKTISKPPFYAARTYPMTRKNMGGPAINHNGQVLNSNRVAIPGLFAAGELTGVAGINGSYGGAGTFLGPSVYTGRIAGAAAAKKAGRADTYQKTDKAPAATRPRPGAPGYWHFDVAHQLVSERGYSCTQCHSDTNPMEPATSRAVLLARLDSCILCH
jgi:predicted oxidoreductase